MQLVILYMRYNQLIPGNKVDISIQVATSHFVALRSLTLRREDNDIEEMS
jgi:hypothetical protein